MAKDKLTKRQAAMLVCIRDHMLRNHYAPTIREIGEEVGLSSTSSVKYQLDALANKGYLIRDARRPRTMELTAAGRNYGRQNGEVAESVFYPNVTPIDRGERIQYQDGDESISLPPASNVPVVGRSPRASPFWPNSTLKMCSRSLASSPEPVSSLLSEGQRRLND